MRDTWLRRLLVLAISLLLLHQVAAWMYSAFGPAAGILAAVVVGVVSLLSARMAAMSSGSAMWFLVPTLLFTFVPLAAKLWTFFTVEKSWWDRAVELAPFIFGFAAPVVLLLVVYADLRTRTAH